MLELNTDNFDQELSKGPTIVDFWAPWCGPCMALAPVFEKVSEKIEGVTFAKLNTDENRELSQKYDVRSIPCLILFKEGKEVGRIIGMKDEPTLTEDIKKLL